MTPCEQLESANTRKAKHRNTEAIGTKTLHESGFLRVGNHAISQPVLQLVPYVANGISDLQLLPNQESI